MPKINLRLSDEEHAALKAWAESSHRSIQREAVYRLFANHVEAPAVETSEIQPAGTAAKKRFYPCKHHVPPTRKCQYCDV